MSTATAPELAAIGSLQEEQHLLRARLAQLRGSLRRQMALEFALDLGALTVAVGAVLVALDAWFRLGLTAREILLAVGAIGIVGTVAIRSIPRVRAARLDDLPFAMTLDRVRPGTGQQVADVLQLPGQLVEARSTASPALVRLAVRRASEALASVDWDGHWNWDRTAGSALALMGAALVPIAFALIAPEAARLSAARWFLGSNERWPQKTYLTVTGLGDDNTLLAPRDEPFALEVRADLPTIQEKTPGWLLTGRGEPFSIREKPKVPKVPATVRLRERTAEGAVRDSVMTAVGPGRFRHELPPSSSSSTFEIVGGDDWLGPIQVERVDRPSLQAMKLRVGEPGAAKGTFRDVGDIGGPLVFLPDTRVELTLVATEPLAPAPRIDVHPGAPPSLHMDDVKTYTASWTLREAMTLEISLTSERTGLNSKPSFLSLGLMKDREPRVTLKAQGVGAHVTPVATIPLTLAATDDLGLAAVRLQFERTVHTDGKSEPDSSKKAIPMPLATEGGRAVLDHQAQHQVDLQSDRPPIGAILRFQAEADDKCARGTQTGRSGIVHLQVVSADELFYEILIRQRAERAKFLAALDAAEKGAATLNGNPSPEDYLTVARSLHTGTRQLDQIASRIADTLQEMKLNQVGSPKSHRLLQEGVIDPIRSLNSGPVSELRTTLQALGAGSKAKAEIEKAKKLDGEVVARMKAILDQMSQWESFVDVVNQVAEVIKIQQKVLKATQDARESRTQEVFDEKKP